MLIANQLLELFLYTATEVLYFPAVGTLSPCWNHGFTKMQTCIFLFILCTALSVNWLVPYCHPLISKWDIIYQRIPAEGSLWRFKEDKIWKITFSLCLRAFILVSQDYPNNNKKLILLVPRRFKKTWVSDSNVQKKSVRCISPKVTVQEVGGT